ncbi:hypothetical protein [Chromobacterium alticapitis]|uniref:Uncharacterized protein n=1 Tax=Chromobacterium alticapitis TaxID=2073169 RepID=A0A2S5DLS3_9NEIS|nr:hypothetical protein [Chromobacterium alticapitis]POZ64000.1 hypothetical protein C2I19_00360 [Chromobacterium alticapitis]
MLKQTAIATLSLILLSGAAMAGSEGNANMKAMRDRMNAQIEQTNQAQTQAPAQNAQATQEPAQVQAQK